MADPARADDMDKILERFGEVQEEYEHLGGYALEAQAREVLHGLGFEDERIDGDVGALSGGWKMRVAMARVLLGRPDVLLMDEPTNHLDIESILWLEEFLKTIPGALLMTSHDREFMNRIVTRIVEIDGGEITAYSGNYDFYERERAIRETEPRGRLRAPAGDARQGAALHRALRGPRRQGGAGAEPGQGARQDREDRAAAEAPQVVKFDFRTPPRSGDEVATLEGVTKRYGKRVVHDGFDLTIRRGERWCVMGKNGAGKSTLLQDGRRRARSPTPGAVKLGASLKMGYFAQQSLDLLDPDLTIWEQLQKDFPHGADRRAAQPARRVPVLGRRRRQADPRALGRREDRASCWRACCSTRRTSSCSTSRRTTSISRPRRCWSRRSRDFEGTMLFVSHDRTFLRGLSNRVLELRRRERHRRAAACSTRAATSSTSSAPATRRPACTPDPSSESGRSRPSGAGHQHTHQHVHLEHVLARACGDLAPRRAAPARRSQHTSARGLRDAMKATRWRLRAAPPAWSRAADAVRCW